MIFLIWVKPKQQIPLWGNDFCLAPHPRKPGRMLSTATVRKSWPKSAMTLAPSPSLDDARKSSALEVGF